MIVVSTLVFLVVFIIPLCYFDFLFYSSFLVKCNKRSEKSDSFVPFFFSFFLSFSLHLHSSILSFCLDSRALALSIHWEGRGGERERGRGGGEGGDSRKIQVFQSY